MKIVSKYVKVICILLICLQLIGFSNIFSFSIFGIDVEEESNDVNSAIVDIDLKPIISSSVVDINTPIRVSFDNTLV